MSRPSRDATPAIRGIKYQCDWSILTWIGLEPSAELFWETDEDWKKLLGQTETLYQSGLRSHNLTLFDDKVLRTILEFTLYKVRNPEKDSRFVFVSNASVGKEQGEKEGLLSQAIALANLSGVAAKALVKIREKSSNAKANSKDSYWRNADVNFTEGDVAATLESVTWLMQQPAPEDLETEVFSELRLRLGVDSKDCPIVYALLLRNVLSTPSGRALKLSDAQAIVSGFHENREEWIRNLSRDDLMKRVLALPAFESIAEKLRLAEVVLTVAPALAQVLDDQLLRNDERRFVAQLVNDHNIERMNEIYRQYESFTEDKLKEKLGEVISDPQKAAELLSQGLTKREAMWKFKERLQASPGGTSALAAVITETYYALEKKEGVLSDVAFREVQEVLKEIVSEIRQLHPNSSQVSLPSDILEGIIHDLSGRCAFRWRAMKSTA